MHPVLAVLLLLLGIGTVQWGAAKIADALSRARSGWGLAPSATGGLVGLATALPETSLNTTSVVLGWPDIGLGAALGSNLPAIPLAFAVAYLSMRWHKAKAVEGPSGEPALAVEAEAVWRVALPYLAAVALVALLTLPAPWEGLQPVDGAILLAAWAAYLAQNILRGRGPGSGERLDRARLLWATLGGGAIAGGAIVAVLGAQPLNRTLGISDFAGGLFIVGGLCALPESFSAWRLARSGKATIALSAVMGDGVTSISLAFVPLCLGGAAVGDKPLYALNLGFVALFVLLYVALSHRAFAGRRFTGPQIAAMGALYAAWLVAYALVAGR